jgi:hypothetical protein
LGHTKTKGYTYGPRTVAGNLIFTVFDHHVFYRLLKKTEAKNTRILSDELPPFDIVISFGSEYSKKSKMVIKGVTIVDEGQVMSINDMITENTMSFVARDVDLMKPIDSAYHSSVDNVDRNSIYNQLSTEVKTEPQKTNDKITYNKGPTGSLTGTVETDDKPAHGLRVSLTSEEAGRKETVFTQKDGRFTFKDTLPATWDLEIDKPGYEDYEDRIEIKANKTKELGKLILSKNFSNVAEIRPSENMDTDKNIGGFRERDVTLEAETISEYGFSVPNIMVQWDIKIDTKSQEIIDEYGKEWVYYGIHETNNDGISKNTIDIPEKLDPGDSINVRVKVIGDYIDSVKPFMFTIRIEEGDAIGR